MQGMNLSMNQADPEFWRGKRVFITGHTGFKGSWLCLLLQHLGARVTGYGSIAPTTPNLFEQARVGSGITSIYGDMGDRIRLTQVMAASQPDIVIHLAGQSLVRSSYDDPASSYAINVMGTVNLLEAVRHVSSVRAVINVTSNACYQNQGWQGGYRENDPLGGYDPHSNSKACAEMTTDTYRNIFFNPLSYADHGVAIATARPSNVIGGGDWAAERLVPDVMQALLRGQPAVVRNPHAVRPWQHVLEPLNGYLLLAERLYREGAAFGEAWNFGPHDRHCETAGAIADQLYIFWGRSIDWQTDDDPSHPYERASLKLDASKAHQRLGWRMVLELKTALRWVVDWTRGYGAGEDMRSLTLSQIQRFLELTHIRNHPRTLADVAQDPQLVKRLWNCG